MSFRLNAPLPIHQVDGRHMKHAFPSLRAWVPYWRLPRRRCPGYFAEVNWPCLIRTYARSSTPDYGPFAKADLGKGGPIPALVSHDRILDVSARPETAGASTVTELIEHWEAVLPVLEAVAADSRARLAAAVRCQPIQPG